jgi:hypothetical protein
MEIAYSSLQAIDLSISRTQELLNQAQRLTYDINRIDQAYQRCYPRAIRFRPPRSSAAATHRRVGRTRSLPTRTRVQAGMVEACETSRAETNGFVSSSQSAVGIRQASQAGNQLIALQTLRMAMTTATWPKLRPASATPPLRPRLPLRGDLGFTGRSRTGTEGSEDRALATGPSKFYLMVSPDPASDHGARSVPGNE